MNCEEAKRRIEFHVLDALSETERLEVETHLAGCSRCSAIEAEYQQIVSGLRKSVNTRRPDIGFERQILQSVKDEIGGTVGHTQSYCTGWFVRVAVAAAACLFVGLILQQSWPYLFGRIPWISTESPTSIQSNIPSYSISTEARAVPASSSDNIVVRGHYVYLLIDDGLGSNVAAIDSLTGRQKWRSKTRSIGHITVSQKHVFCLAAGSAGGLDLVGIDIDDGSTVWRYPQKTSDSPYGICAPTVLPGERICWTTNTAIHVLRSSDGEVVWTRTIPGETLMSAATAVSSNIYVAGITGLYCWDIASGERLWYSKYDVKVSRWARPLMDACDDRICVGLRLPSGQSRLLCMNLSDQKTIWTETMSGVSQLCIGGSRLFVRNQGVQALDMKSGESLWSFASTGCSPLTYADHRIWFVDANNRGHLVALYEHNGKKILDLTGIRSCNAFVERDGKGYVKTHDGAIHVVLLKS